MKGIIIDNAYVIGSELFLHFNRNDNKDAESKMYDCLLTDMFNEYVIKYGINAAYTHMREDVRVIKRYNLSDAEDLKTLFKDFDEFLFKEHFLVMFLTAIKKGISENCTLDDLVVLNSIVNCDYILNHVIKK